MDFIQNHHIVFQEEGFKVEKLFKGNLFSELLISKGDIIVYAKAGEGRFLEVCEFSAKNLNNDPMEVVEFKYRKSPLYNTLHLVEEIKSFIIKKEKDVGDHSLLLQAV